MDPRVERIMTAADYVAAKLGGVKPVAGIVLGSGLGKLAEHIENKSHEEVFKTILAGTREHARVLLPWNEKLPEYHAGLVQDVKEDVLEVYKELIALRQSDKTFVYGDFHVIDKKKDFFTFSRALDGKEYVMDCNLGKERRRAYPPGKGFELVFPANVKEMNVLDAYEARIWRKKI